MVPYIIADYLATKVSLLATKTIFIAHYFITSIHKKYCYLSRLSNSRSSTAASSIAHASSLHQLFHGFSCSLVFLVNSVLLLANIFVVRGYRVAVEGRDDSTDGSRMMAF
jgi:hypothetical protein